MNPLTAFVTGLSTGGLTCLAVQGGLLLGVLARRNGNGERSELRGWQCMVLPVSAFLIAKLIAYTLFGFALGVLGEKIQLGSTARIWLQVAAALFMLVAAARLIWPHFLPWLTFQPPATIRRFVRRSARSEALVAPALLGLLTVLLPCGTTIAMEAAAIATGSPWQSAAILFAFVLGTFPLFFIIGVLAKGSNSLQQKLKFITAAIVFGIGLYSLNGALVMADSPYSFQNQRAAWARAFQREESPDGPASDQPVIEVSAYGYSPSRVTVPSGKEVTLNLVAKGPLGCASLVRIPKLGIEQQVRPNGTTKIAATFKKPGTYTLTCGMGMYTTKIVAI